ncbi:MAG: O-antigen ligase family protein [Nitrososphaerota archaeon]|nr:O-antigen ligase family protein [Nitrososphaerota archaeon]
MSLPQIGFWILLFFFPILLAGTIASSTVLAAPYIRYAIYLYLGVIIFFTGNTYGLVTQDAVIGTIYARGSGKLFFGFVNIYLYWLGMVTLFSALWNQRRPPVASIRKYLLFFVLVYLTYIAFGLFLKQPLLIIISQTGVLNVFNMTVLIYVLLRAFNDHQSVDELIRVFVAFALLRGLFGLFRFAFLGGDPANYYANFQGIPVKLTFFDINDSIIAGMAAFLSAWRLFDRESAETRRDRFAYCMIFVIGVFVILFSYRRTAWLGLIPPALLLTWWNRQRLNLFIALPMLFSMSAAIFMLWLARFHGDASHHADLLALLFPDATSNGHFSLQSHRFFELRLALDTLRRHWLFGVGPWGTYQWSWNSDVNFHNGNFNFVHSAILQLWLKVGLAGLCLFLSDYSINKQTQCNHF